MPPRHPFFFFNLITGLLQYSRLKGWNNCGCNTQTNRCYKWFSKLKQNIATEQIGFLFWYSKVYKVQTFPIRNINYTFDDTAVKMIKWTLWQYCGISTQALFITVSTEQPRRPHTQDENREHAFLQSGVFSPGRKSYHLARSGIKD